MLDVRPYILRSMHEWTLDSGMTPQITIDTSVNGVVVPESFANDKRMVLNIHPDAVRDLSLGPDVISFHARFAGMPHFILIPFNAVLAIFCRENGCGLVFDGGAGKSLFALIGDWDDDPNEPTPERKGPRKHDNSADATDAKRPPKKGPPNLKVVK